MAAYLERLGGEDDPARLATMAEEMPEPPSLEAWADLGTLDITLEPAPAMETISDPWAAPAAEPVAELVEGADATETAPDPEAFDGSAEAGDEPIDAEAVAGHVEAVFADFAAAETGAVETEAIADVADEPVAEPAIEAVADDPSATDTAGAPTPGGDPWTSETNAWGTQASSHDGTGGEDDNVARWADGDTPDGFPSEGGDPVDRGAIMAALEAAAEAVVAAESAAESADQAEAAADVAETAAGLLTGRPSADGESDPEAEAAMNARMDAGGFETETFADRLASLLPNQGEGSADDEPRTTQVIVSGLVSVASIASFKRHLGRLAGVQNVAVASGPEGEFVFNVTHRADVSFRDAIPTMPGFAARVTSAGDGVVHVTARDPETDG